MSDSSSLPPGEFGLNLEKGDLFFRSKRGDRLHLRSYVPENPADIKAVVFFFHGYCGHSSSPSKKRFAEHLCAQGYAVIQPDAVGHGWSEGTRAYVQDWKHWLQDQRLLLNLIAGGPNAVNTKPSDGGSTAATAAADSEDTRPAASLADADTTATSTAAGKDNASSSDSSSDDCNLGLTKEQAERLAQVPIFLTGESLGGGQSLSLGLMLQEEVEAATAAATAAVANGNSDSKELQVAKRFGGVCLIAPAIRGNPPPKIVCTILRYCIVPFVPERCVPGFLEVVAIPEYVWLNPVEMKKVMDDRYGDTPTSLGWGRNMRWGMALNMLDLCEHVEKSVPKFKFPFQSQHDPGDQIVLFSGSQLLQDKAGTAPDAQEPSRSREVVRMDGMLHDLLTNCCDKIVNNMHDWIEDRLKKINSSSGNTN